MPPATPVAGPNRAPPRLHVAADRTRLPPGPSRQCYGDRTRLMWTGTRHRFLHGCPPPAYAVHCVIVVAAESRATTDVLEMLAAEVVEVMAAGPATSRDRKS